MTKKFEVGKYAINNKGIGIAGPQSTIYKVTALSKKKTMIGEVYKNAYLTASIAIFGEKYTLTC